MPRRTFLDHPGPIAFAHRGGALDEPENSLEAFGAAVALGYRYLETDVHVTADGHLVAFHDAVLDRVTDRTGAIADLTWEEVSAARIEGRGTIPLFEDLLRTWPEIRLNVDPKADRSVEPLIDVIRRHDAAHRVCVGAFSDRRIARVADALGPDLCVGLGPRAVAKLRLAATGVPVGQVPGHCAQVPTRYGRVPIVTERFVREAHRRDIAVHVWTIDDEDEMHRLLDLGVDGIMTDRPTALRDVFGQRGLWH